MEKKLRKLLEDFEYESSRSIELNIEGEWVCMKRRLKPHHIEALMKELVPFIVAEKKETADSFIGKFNPKAPLGCKLYE